MTMIEKRVTHFHLFCGLGGGAKGFNRGEARVGNLQAKFECLGGVDVDPAGLRDFRRLAGVNGTVLDLFDRSQYIDFHGHEPPEGWREAMPQDIQRAAGGQRPNIVFLSAPCKGFSGLLSEAKSKGVRYQALNRLTLRGVWLMLEAWADDPPELVLFENVPRLATRGRALLDRITAMLRGYGYATAETTHDCGELGGLAQSRKRFLLVARHMAKVPPLLYEPARRPLRAVGDVLGRMLLPGDLRAGPMHRMPALQWKTWVRLAFVEAGSDWRSLNKLAVHDGKLRDFLVVPAMHGGTMAVRRLDQAAGTVTGNARALTGAFSVADPRAAAAAAQYQQYGVRLWDESTGAVIGVKSPGQGSFSVADPRHGGPAKHSNEFRVVRWDGHSMAVTSAHGTGQAIADPRPGGDVFGKYGVTDWTEPAGTVISGSTTGQGAFAVADPRPKPGPLFSKYPVAQWDDVSRTVISGDDCGAYSVADPRSGMAGDRADYLTGGHYGVIPWQRPAGTVSAAACHDNGRWSVADPRGDHFPDGGKMVMPAADQKLVARITALDGTWHRPFTTLELAVLQSLVDPEEQLELDGLSDQAWRERIGNAVPSDAAQAIASEMGRTLLLAWSGETFALSAAPVWVRPLAVGLSVAQGGAQ